MGKNAEYAEQYKDAAMEQMRRYGIPASVTLAQGILESSNGKSELSQLGNNHFGIKATRGWLAAGGDYLVYTDDRPNEKFCKYDSVADSYEHHSQFLAQNSRYARCFKLSPDDYKGWTEGIARAGYASGSSYAKNLQTIIEANGLDKYDRQVMQEMQAEGRKFGVENNPLQNHQATNAGNPNDGQQGNLVPTGEYSFPVKRDEFLFITSPFGMRTDPMGSGKQQMHKGIDIKTKSDAVLATENGGKVVDVNHNANTAGGRSVTVEYQRADGSKVQNTYMHLSSINVGQGDTVQAGQKLGVSGNTGTRTTGEHLHLGVKTITSDGKSRDVDPAAYLAEIGQKGNIQLQALHNGNDLLAKYKSSMAASNANLPSMTTPMSPDAWMKKLLSSEDSGLQMDGSNPIVSMAMTMFSSLMLLATQIDAKDEEEQKNRISEAMSKQQIDLSTMVKGMKECKLTIGHDGRATLSADNGSTKVTRDLSNAEMSRLQTILGADNLTDEGKKIRIAGLVNGIVISQQVSQNYENIEQRGQQQEQTIKR